MKAAVETEAEEQRSKREGTVHPDIERLCEIIRHSPHLKVLGGDVQRRHIRGDNRRDGHSGHALSASIPACSINAASMTQLLDVMLNTDNDIQYMNMNDPMSHELSFKQEHLDTLVEVLKKGKLWCLNIGEIGIIKGLDWNPFVEGLKETNVTHLYVSDNQLGSKKKACLDVLRVNRVSHRGHLFEHDVIDACKRMWFTPKASRLYQDFFKKRPYDEAKALAHDKPRLAQVTDRLCRLVSSQGCSLHISPLLSGAVQIRKEAVEVSRKQLVLEVNQLLDQIRLLMQELEGRDTISQGRLGEIKAQLKDQLQDCYVTAGSLNYGPTRTAGVESMERLEGAAQLLAKLGLRNFRQLHTFKGRCYVLLAQCPEKRVMKKRNVNDLKFCGRSYVRIPGLKRIKLDPVNEQSLEKTNEQSLEKTNEQSLQKTNELSLDKTNEQSLQKTNELSLEQANELSLEQANETLHVEQTIEQALGQKIEIQEVI